MSLLGRILCWLGEHDPTPNVVYEDDGGQRLGNVCRRCEEVTCE